MAQYATAADLSTLLDCTFDAGDTTRATLLLEMISDDIQGYCTKDNFEQSEDDSVNLRGNWSSRLYLPKGPVASVSSVTVDGTTVNSSSYSLIAGRTLVRKEPTQSTFGDPILTGLNWGGPNRQLVVVYTHGWTSVPADVQRVALRAAARVWGNPEARKSVSLPPSYRVEFADLEYGYLTAGDCRALAKYRLTGGNDQ